MSCSTVNRTLEDAWWNLQRLSDQECSAPPAALPVTASQGLLEPWRRPLPLLDRVGRSLLLPVPFVRAFARLEREPPSAAFGSPRAPLQILSAGAWRM